MWSAPQDATFAAVQARNLLSWLLPGVRAEAGPTVARARTTASAHDAARANCAAIEAERTRSVVSR